MVREATVLITGSSGFLGGHLRSALHTSWPGARVVGVSRSPSPRPGEWLPLDLLDAPAVQRLVTSLRPDCVFHLAGQIHSNEWSGLYRGNVETTLNLLESLRALANPPRIVIAGSAAEYGRIDEDQLPITERLAPNPISRYGVAKAWQTICARSFASKALPIVVGRVFNIVGAGLPETSSFGTFTAQLERMANDGAERCLRVGNLTSRRDWVDVGDVCKALIDLAARGQSGEIYNVCSGLPVRMDYALSTLIALSGMSVEVVTDEARYRADDVPVSYGSRDKIGTATGWVPRVLLADSLQSMLDAAMKRGRIAAAGPRA